MSLLMSKKKKKEIELQQDQLRIQRELQAKVRIKRTLNQMRNNSKKFEVIKKNYIEKARQATLVGNQQTYQLAKSGLKICLSKQRLLDSMICNFEVAMEINDMNKLIGEFVDGINIISKQMKNITSTVDMTKAQSAFDQAMVNNLSQYEALDAFLSSAVDSFESMDTVSDGVSDEEIDSLISNQVADAENEIDQEIDKKIGQVREKMGTI